MVRRAFFLLLVVVPAAIVAGATRWPGLWWSFVVIGPLVLIGLHDVLQRRHSLLRVYPVIGHGRYLMEALRPEIQQYFVESNIDGLPFSREQRSVIYQRGKGELDTLPFGTQREVYRPGFEWVGHSLAPKTAPKSPWRVCIGDGLSQQAYEASYLNVSAMSFGSLSRNAIRALNRGAKIDDFAHNTGEGGVSPYHLEAGGDLIWQIGTGYFGCRAADGSFDPERFAEQAQVDSIRMIEVKLSQGAKPGHGGILPAAKVSPEIARIRGVPLGQDVLSPPAHRAFDGPLGLLEFVTRLRDLSGGKPVGFKLCVGKPVEFLAICKAMLRSELLPDFITVDGTEGGTGAAPLELSNAVGMPLRQGLRLVDNALRGIGVRDKIKVIAAGKIVTGFDIFRAIALGADLCKAARAMMFALGCIQARRCNHNDCPVGVATQDPAREVGIDVEDKAQRVARYHRATLHSFAELVGAVGLDNPKQIGAHHLMRQLDADRACSYAEIYERLEHGVLCSLSDIPANWEVDWQAADPRRFAAA